MSALLFTNVEYHFGKSKYFIFHCAKNDFLSKAHLCFHVSVRYLYFVLLCFQEKCFGFLKTFKLKYPPLDNLKTSRVNNSRVLCIRNGKFSGYCFHMSPNI